VLFYGTMWWIHFRSIGIPRRSRKCSILFSLLIPPPLKPDICHCLDIRMEERRTVMEILQRVCLAFISDTGFLFWLFCSLFLL
jgi:hypothetical protein